MKRKKSDKSKQQNSAGVWLNQSDNGWIVKNLAWQFSQLWFLEMEAENESRFERKSAHF